MGGIDEERQSDYSDLFANKSLSCVVYLVGHVRGHERDWILSTG